MAKLQDFEYSRQIGKIMDESLCSFLGDKWEYVAYSYVASLMSKTLGESQAFF